MSRQLDQWIEGHHLLTGCQGEFNISSSALLSASGEPPCFYRIGAADKSGPIGPYRVFREGGIIRFRTQETAAATAAMKTTFALLCLVLAVSSQLLGGSGNANVAGRATVASLFLAPGASGSANATLANNLLIGGLANLQAATNFGASITVTNSGSTSGYFILEVVAIANAQYSAGFSGILSGGAAATTGFGYASTTNLTAGSFAATLTISPPAAQLSGGLAYQLFLYQNSSSGLSGSGSSSNSNEGALSYQTNGASYTYTLPSVPSATYQFSAYNTSSIAFYPFPAIYGVLATTQANVATTFQYGASAASALYLTIKTDAAATINTTFTNVAAIKSAASATFLNVTNKAYTDLKAFYRFTVNGANTLRGDLIYSFNQTLVAALNAEAKAFKWAQVNADGTINFLNTTLTSTTNAAGQTLYNVTSQLNTTANAAVQYAVYVEQNVANGVQNNVQQILNNGVSTNQTFLLGTFFVAPGASVSSAQFNLLLPYATGYSVSLFVNNTGSASGYVSLYSAFFAGVGYSNGISSALYGNGQAGASFGFYFQSDLTSNFYANLTITRPTLTVSANAQLGLFYVINGTDGFTTYGSQSNQYAQTASIPGSNSNVVIYSLVNSPSAYYVLGQVDTSTPAVIPALIGLQTAVYANANATYNYANGIALNLVSQTTSRLNSTLYTTADLASQVNGAVQTKVNATVNGVKKTLVSTGYYVKFFLEGARSFSGHLIYNLTQEAAARFNTTYNQLQWVQIDASGSATVLVTGDASSSAGSSSSTGSAASDTTVSSDNAYGVYYAAQADSSVNGGGASVSASANGNGGSTTGDAKALFASVLLIGAAVVAAL
ncbi:surface-exposed protein [Planoprotostelium fungivorum]|uniref:Surface-exposed protein n=1 Tax=Planoprotostelium fungivorum TaxID=1890364 RepID=A0A2P6ND96_9EUKA|nr:surface-exposed protein [Planoprotostelium fungivorum]